MTSSATSGTEHIEALAAALARSQAAVDITERWGVHLAKVLGSGGRLLAAGNGGALRRRNT